MNPKTLQWLVIAAAIFYLVLPYDLVPDFFGLPGRIDDLLMMAWLTWLYQTRRAEWFARSGAGNESRDKKAKNPKGPSGTRPNESGSRPNSEQALPDPHGVLGVSTSASAEEIRKAYRERMQEYHPDKVAHLGKELQDLALEKSQEIGRAYRQLVG